MDDIDDESLENEDVDVSLERSKPAPERGRAASAPAENPLSKLIKSASTILGSAPSSPPAR